MKTWRFTLLTLLLIAALAACGGNALDSENDTVGNLPTITPTRDLSEFEGTVITIGGWGFSPETRGQVVAFNRENEQYRIEIINYRLQDMTRLRTELITGGGPDILYSHTPYVLHSYDDMFVPMISRGMFLDLWPFIDADPEINREDFFQNILEARQTADGSLPVIANRFWVETIRGVPETVSHPDAWTAAALLTLVREAFDAGIPYPLGEWMSGERFLLFLLSNSGTELIDFDAGVSHLDSQAFYDILELVALLPRAEDIPSVVGASAFARIRDGEQILLWDVFHSPGSYAGFMPLAGPLMEPLVDLTILGFPSSQGSMHSASLMSSMGINVNSANPEAAWSFIRRFLLPDAHIEFFGIPIRIDLYEEKVAEAMQVRETYITPDGREIGLSGVSAP